MCVYIDGINNDDEEERKLARRAENETKMSVTSVGEQFFD